MAKELQKRLGFHRARSRHQLFDQICAENFVNSPSIFTEKWCLYLKISLKADKSKHLERKQTKSLIFVEIVKYRIQI